MATRWPCCRRSPGGEVEYLVNGPIDITELIRSVGAPELGGMSLFLGTVRRGPEDGPVREIEYSAYPEMVGGELDRILREASARWPGVRFGVRHRVGWVPVGEASVAVVAAAPHRAESFDACRHVIEELKRRVPIWKKEIMEDGSAKWPANRSDGESDT